VANGPNIFQMLLVKLNNVVSRPTTVLVGLRDLRGYPEPTHVNPVTGELALNGSTDKARFIACVAHVSNLYRPLNELCLANEKHSRSNQHPTRNARSSARGNSTRSEDTSDTSDSSATPSEVKWRPEARSPNIYDVYYVAGSRRPASPR